MQSPAVDIVGWRAAHSFAGDALSAAPFCGLQSMVLFAAARWAPPPCAGLPGPPRAAAVCWEQAAAAERASFTLPTFSMLGCSGRGVHEQQPGVTFKQFAAALTAEGSEWSTGDQGLHPLHSLHGCADVLPLQPQLLPQHDSGGDMEAVPAFLLFRRRMPHTDNWLQCTRAIVDVPCLPEPVAAAQLHQVGCYCAASSTFAS